VFQGELRAAFTNKGELVQTVSNLAPIFEANTGAVTAQAVSQTLAADAADAVVNAARTIGVPITAADLQLKDSSLDGAKFVFGNSVFTEDVKVEAVYFPVEQGSITRAWSMVLWQDNPAYYTIVSADNGTLLWRKNITNDQTQTAT